jgi:hypothetical protein
MPKKARIRGSVPSWKAKLKSGLIQQSLRIWGLLAAAAFATVEVTLQPVQESVKYLVWPENVTVYEKINANQGEVTKVKVAVNNRSSVAGISGGQVEFNAPTDGTVVVHGRETFSFQKSDTTITGVPSGDEWFTFTPNRPGPLSIPITVRTGRGTFRGKLDVQVFAKPADSRPSSLNFAGLWQVRVNEKRGMMTLEQTVAASSSELPKQFKKGFIRFNDGSQWEIYDGHADGSHFELFAKDTDAKEYYVDGTWCEFQKGTHLVVNAGVAVSLKGRQIDQPYIDSSLEEKCINSMGQAIINLPGNVKPGNASFQLSAELRSR